MATHRLRRTLDHLQLALAPPGADALTDAHLLARFLTCRDETAFAALVRRHGPMVLGVCRRVLGHAHDAEDAFQAAFMVLARKAGSVLKREAVGSWLYMVAYRAAQRARANQARRRAREKQVDEMPHPEVQPEEAQDWWPLLDDELGRLPEKYRAPIVLCDLEGQPRKEAARQLRLPPGTLSSRLATGRRLLAERLSRRGVALSGGALAAALSYGAARASPAAPLVLGTAKAAVLVAAGHLAAVSTPVAVLTKGVLQAMFLTKLKIAVGLVLAVVVLGTGGLAYRSADAQTVQQPSRAEGKPQGEVESLRKEVELLRLNLLLVLEKVRVQETELRTLRGQAEARVRDGLRALAFSPDGKLLHVRDGTVRVWDATSGKQVLGLRQRDGQPADPAQQAEAALKALREAKDDTSRRRAVDALERALRELRQRHPLEKGKN
jgi:RNA polymerase sigma factor (sigma-70 family)